MKGFLSALKETVLAWGPLGLFLFAVADGAGVPTPGGLDVALVVLAVNRPSQAYLLATLTLLGSLIGCMFMFCVARKAGEAALRRYRGRARFQRLERWFRRYGLVTVFIPALIPIPTPLKFFVICAGVFGVRPAAFFFTLLAARVPRYLGLAYLGAKLGTESLPWLKAHAWHMAAVAAGLFAISYLLIVIAERRRRLTGLE